MEQLTRDNIEKVQRLLDNETRKIKSFGIASAFTSVAGPLVVSALTIPHELFVTSLIGASGVGITLKFLYDKLRLEKTEKHISQISKRLETDKEFESEFNEELTKDSDIIRSGMFKWESKNSEWRIKK